MEELTYEYAKEFPIPNSHKCFNISRELLESMPCPLVACCWTDKRMEQLADEIGTMFQEDKDPRECGVQNEEEQVWKEYYDVIENTALNMGMKYYESLSDDAYDKITEWCNNHTE